MLDDAIVVLLAFALPLVWFYYIEKRKEEGR